MNQISLKDKLIVKDNNSNGVNSNGNGKSENNKKREDKNTGFIIDTDIDLNTRGVREGDVREIGERIVRVKIARECWGCKIIFPVDTMMEVVTRILNDRPYHFYYCVWCASILQEKERDRLAELKAKGLEPLKPKRGRPPGSKTKNHRQK